MVSILHSQHHISYIQPCVKNSKSISCQGASHRVMLTTNDIIALTFGLSGTLFAIITIFATLMMRRTSRTPDMEMEMQPLTRTPSEHETTLKVLELVLGFFRRGTY